MSLRSTLALVFSLCILVPAALAAAPTHRVHKNPKTPTVINLDTDGYSTEGTALAGHFRGSTLEKIVARHYGETGKTIEEYTFTSGHLSFLLAIHYRYNGNIASTTNLKVASTTATRYYYSGDRLKRCIEGGKSVTLTAERRKDAAQCLIDARNFATLLQKERARVEQSKATQALLAPIPSETGTLARARGIDYSATVQHALAKDPKAMHTLFGFSTHTIAASSKGHGAVLAEVLRTDGDSYFADCLRNEPSATIHNVRIDLETAFPASTLHRQYPKTYALIKNM